MLRIQCEITIGPVTFKYAEGLSIEKTWQRLGNTARFTIPNKVRDQVGKSREVFGAEKLILHGDPVTIKLGYFPELHTEFEGFVTEIIPDYPLTVECEDISYKVKQTNVNGTFKDTTLSEFLSSVSEVPTKANVKANLGTLRIDNVGLREVIEEVLSPKYGLSGFVRDGTVEVGVPYPDKGESFEYEFGRDIIADNLEFRSKEERRWKVRGVSPQADGSKIEVEVGDSSGSGRTFFKYDVDESTLRESAERFYERLDFEGYSGSFTTFGDKRPQFGDNVKIIHPRLPQREGTYKIKKVITKFGSMGFRKELVLDERTQ